MVLAFNLKQNYYCPQIRMYPQLFFFGVSLKTKNSIQPFLSEVSMQTDACDSFFQRHTQIAVHS